MENVKKTHPVMQNSQRECLLPAAVLFVVSLVFLVFGAFYRDGITPPVFSEDYTSYLYGIVMTYPQLYYGAAALAVGVYCGFRLFWIFSDQNQLYMHLSMGVSRKVFFRDRLLGTIAPLCLAVGIPFLINEALNVQAFGFHSEYLRVWFGFLLSTLSTVYYGVFIGALACILTQRKILSPIVAVLFGVCIPALNTVFKLAYVGDLESINWGGTWENRWFGSPLGNVLWYWNKDQWGYENSVVYPTMKFGMDKTHLLLQPIVWLILLGLLFWALQLVFRKKLHIEGGEAIRYPLFTGTIMALGAAWLTSALYQEFLLIPKQAMGSGIDVENYFGHSISELLSMNTVRYIWMFAVCIFIAALVFIPKRRYVYMVLPGVLLIASLTVSLFYTSTDAFGKNKEIPSGVITIASVDFSLTKTTDGKKETIVLSGKDFEDDSDIETLKKIHKNAKNGGDASVSGEFKITYYTWEGGRYTASYTSVDAEDFARLKAYAEKGGRVFNE